MPVGVIFATLRTGVCSLAFEMISTGDELLSQNFSGFVVLSTIIEKVNAKLVSDVTRSPCAVNQRMSRIKLDANGVVALSASSPTKAGSKDFCSGKVQTSKTPNQSSESKIIV